MYIFVCKWRNYFTLSLLLCQIIIYSHRKVVLKNDRFSSVLLTRRKTQTMQRIGEALQRSQRRGGKAGNYKTTSRWLYFPEISIGVLR